MRRPLEARQPNLAAPVSAIPPAQSPRSGRANVDSAQVSGNRAGLRNLTGAIYQPLHYGALPAKVLAIRSDGTADLEILNPDGTMMMLLTRIKLHASKTGCGRGEAYLA